METQLFEWESWDEAGDYGDFMFNNCTLKKPVGKFKTGTKFDNIAVLFGQGIIELYRNVGSKVDGFQKQEVAGTYKLLLRVGPEHKSE